MSKVTIKHDKSLKSIKSLERLSRAVSDGFQDVAAVDRIDEAARD